MDKKKLTETDIRTKFITPALVEAGWDLHRQIREEVALTNGCILVKGQKHNGQDNQFMLLLLKAFKSRFVGQGAGGAQPNISRIKIINTVAPLPPLEEQKRIVAKVDRLMALCEQLEAKLKQTQATGEKLVQATVQSLVAA
jgi:restriction endonuclease S subunit